MYWANQVAACQALRACEKMGTGTGWGHGSPSFVTHKHSHWRLATDATRIMRMKGNKNEKEMTHAPLRRLRVAAKL